MSDLPANWLANMMAGAAKHSETETPQEAFERYMRLADAIGAKFTAAERLEMRNKFFEDPSDSNPGS